MKTPDTFKVYRTAFHLISAELKRKNQTNKHIHKKIVTSNYNMDLMHCLCKILLNLKFMLQTKEKDSDSKTNVFYIRHCLSYMCHRYTFHYQCNVHLIHPLCLFGLCKIFINFFFQLKIFL